MRRYTEIDIGAKLMGVIATVISLVQMWLGHMDYAIWWMLIAVVWLKD